MLGFVSCVPRHADLRDALSKLSQTCWPRHIPGDHMHAVVHAWPDVLARYTAWLSAADSISPIKLKCVYVCLCEGAGPRNCIGTGRFPLSDAVFAIMMQHLSSHRSSGPSKERAALLTAILQSEAASAAGLQSALSLQASA